MTNNKMNILGVVEPYWHGVKRSLFSMCDEVVYPKHAISKIQELNPKLVLLGCYRPEWRNILLEAKSRNIKVIAVWYASFILNEFDHINRVWMASMINAYRQGLIHIIATPHAGLAETFRRFGIKTQYLPCVINPDTLPAVPKLKGVNIGILGSGQDWKNMECQIIAASFIKDAVIHIQYIKHPEIIKALNLQKRLVVHPHIGSDKEYYKLVGGMTINMVVSLSEVFSYLTAESMLLKTPILTGTITPIFRGDDLPEILQVCCMPYFEDPVAIEGNLTKILQNYREIQNKGQQYISQYIKRGNSTAARILKGWFL